MAEKFFSERNLKFLLYEVFDAESITHYPYFETYDRKMFDMVLQAAIELAEKLLLPNFQEMDRSQPELAGDQVRVHSCMRSIMKEFGMGGWIGTTVSEEKGGEQLPHLVADACYFVFAAANYSAFAYAVLSAGAAHLMDSFASQDLFDTYVPKMLSGKWQGTMAMTEPEAGSSLADIETEAEPTGDGYYRIKGQKIFISAGDHDAVENIVHLMLAKVKGAPPGVKGISLFVVPKLRTDESGKLVSNDVATSGIFHKLGYRGCPITQLSIGDKDDCRAWLVGEENKGLFCMFQMMNEERIAVGIGAAAMASAAYYASLEYSRLRRQGRKLSEKDPLKPQVPIIEHSDIKRMLLFQRAVVEGALSLIIQCSKYVDLQRVCDGDEKEKYNLLLEILTPVAKSYPAETGLLSISQGLQCLGGSGYCDDYPLEQYYRDARIHPIHEGTTGIQGIDLLGRKVVMKGGKALSLYIEEVEKCLSRADGMPELKRYASELREALKILQVTTDHLKDVAGREGPELFLSDATLYLELFGIVTVAWQWLLQAIAVQEAMERDPSNSDKDFLKGKFYTFRFFFGYELPKIEGLARRLRNSDGLTLEVGPEHFAD